MSEHRKPFLGETVWLRVVQLLRFCRGSPHYSEWTRGEMRENKPGCVCVWVCIVQAVLAASGSWKWQFHIFIFDLPIDDNTVESGAGVTDQGDAGRAIKEHRKGGKGGGGYWTRGSIGAGGGGGEAKRCQRRSNQRSKK